jgi:hypothetical protein
VTTRIERADYRRLDDDQRELFDEWIAGVVGEPIGDARILWAELGEGELVCEQIVPDDDGLAQRDPAAPDQILTRTTRYAAPVPPPAWPPRS